MERSVFDAKIGRVVEFFGNRIIDRNSVVSWQTGWADSLYNAYEEERLAIRKQMKMAPDLLKHRIDRHKIAAALTRAILRTNPLVPQSTPDGKLSVGARLANENLTLVAGMAIVIQIAGERFVKASGSSAAFTSKPVVFPPANDGSYTLHYAKAMYHTKSRGIDSLVLAHTFFLLEAFHFHAIGVGPVPPLVSEPEAAEAA